jgi:acyl carrier protein
MTPDKDDTAVSSDSTLEKLREIWESVLQVKNVDISNCFVDLGGDSLAAMSCISRVQKEFGIEFTIWDFYTETSSISDFAIAIRQSGTDPKPES